MKTTTAHADAPPSAPPTSGLVIWAYLLLVVGLFVLVFYAFYYDTSLKGVAVSNVPLLLDRLIGVLVGLTVSFTGALCFIAQALRSPATKPSAKAPPAPSSPSDPAKPESQPRSVHGELQQGRRRR